MISWHALYEQLQSNPELVEEELALDNIAVNSEVDWSRQNERKDSQREQEALRKLQAKLGNAGMQKLIILQEKAKVKIPVKMNSPPAPVTEQQGHQVSVVDQAQQSANESVELTTERAVDKTAAKTPPEVADLVEGSSVERADAGDTCADTRKLQEGDLQRFISRLPNPPVVLWHQVSDLYGLLDGARQMRLLKGVVKIVRAAPRPDQESFFTGVSRLPSSVSKSAFVSILLQQLRAVLASLQVETEVEPPPAQET